MLNWVFKFCIAVGFFGLMIGSAFDGFVQGQTTASQGRRTGYGTGECESLAGTALLEYG